MANSYETDMRAAILALMNAREALERAGEYAFTDIADKLLEDASDRLHAAKIEAEYDKPNLSDADAASISADALGSDRPTVGLWSVVDPAGNVVFTADNEDKCAEYLSGLPDQAAVLDGLYSLYEPASEDDEPEAEDFEDHMNHDTSMNG